MQCEYDKYKIRVSYLSPDQMSKPKFSKDSQEMELELGLKLARVADEFASSELLIAKDRGGPLFLSRETDNMFILTAHLKGYNKRNIKIDINEDGSRIAISGEKAIQETVMVNWKLYKKESETRVFRKVFKIPDGAVLDKIKAKFDEEESILTISMPKKEKGIRGFSAEEVKDQELGRGASETLQVAVDQDFPRENTMKQGIDREPEAKYHEESEPTDGKSPEVTEVGNGKEPEGSLEKVELVNTGVAYPEDNQIDNLKEQAMKDDQKDQSDKLEKVVEQSEHEAEVIEGSKDLHLPDEVTQGLEKPTLQSTATAPDVEGHIDTAPIPRDGKHRQEIEKEAISQSIQEGIEKERDQLTPLKQTTNADQINQVHGEVESKLNTVEEEEESFDVVKPPEEAQGGSYSSTREREKKGSCKICTPIVAGSALLLSLVVFVIQIIRKKSQPSKNKD